MHRIWQEYEHRMLVQTCDTFLGSPPFGDGQKSPIDDNGDGAEEVTTPDAVFRGFARDDAGPPPPGANLNEHYHDRSSDRLRQRLATTELFRDLTEAAWDTGDTACLRRACEIWDEHEDKIDAAERIRECIRVCVVVLNSSGIEARRVELFEFLEGVKR